MPEYNHGFCAGLKNAIDYLHGEWADKPVGFVSYGGVSGGTRAVQLLKPVLTCLRMLPVTDQVALANHAQHMHDGRFEPGTDAALAGRVMLDELYRTTATIRRDEPAAVA
jgi:NAD(P)H-dependent FMN reductase